MWKSCGSKQREKESPSRLLRDLRLSFFPLPFTWFISIPLPSPFYIQFSFFSLFLPHIFISILPSSQNEKRREEKFCSLSLESLRIESTWNSETSLTSFLLLHIKQRNIFFTFPHPFHFLFSSYVSIYKHTHTTLPFLVLSEFLRSQPLYPCFNGERETRKISVIINRMWTCDYNPLRFVVWKKTNERRRGLTKSGQNKHIDKRGWKWMRNWIESWIANHMLEWIWCWWKEEGPGNGIKKKL